MLSRLRDGWTVWHSHVPWVLTEFLPRGEEGGGESGGGRVGAYGRIVALHGVLGLSHVLIVVLTDGAIGAAAAALLLQRDRLHTALLLL